MAPVKEVLANGDVRWKERVWVTEGTHKVRKKVTGRTKAECQDLVDALRSRRRNQRLGIEEAQQLKEATLTELFSLMSSRYTKRESSLESLTWHMNAAREHFGDWPVADIKYDDVEAWFVALCRSKSPRTAKNYLFALRQVLTWGVKRGYLRENPTLGIDLPAGHEGTNAADPFESWEEVTAVADALAERYVFGRQLVMFACATALRPQEWSALEHRDVDLTAGQVNIRRTRQRDRSLTDQGKTKESLAPVLLPEIAVEAIRSMPTPLNRETPLFPNPGGRVWDADNFNMGYWKPALEAAGIRYRPPKHLRHTCATLALASGVPLEWVSKHLRHTNMETTRKHYARWIRKAELHWLSVFNAGVSDPNETLVPAERLG